jgi:hypothetical protein
MSVHGLVGVILFWNDLMCHCLPLLPWIILQWLLSLLEKPKPLDCSPIHGLVPIGFPNHVLCVWDKSWMFVCSSNYDFLMHCVLKIKLSETNSLVPFTLSLHWQSVNTKTNVCLSIRPPEISVHPETWRHIAHPEEKWHNSIFMGYYWPYIQINYW